jgi:hypothetical protein
MIKYLIIGITLLLAGVPVSPKNQSFKLSKDDISFEVMGTSNLHDWKMNLEIFECTANFILAGSRLKSIDDVTFSCKSTDLKSNSSLMDKKTYSALKSGTFPEIRFNMSSGINISSDNNNFTEKLKGDLFLSGKSVAVIVPVSGRIYDNNGTKTIDVQGKTELKMSDFDISPPSFMMGTLKTGDKVTILFSLSFQEKQEENR